MVWDNTATAADYLHEQNDGRVSLSEETGARLAVENQVGDANRAIYSFASLVSLEITFASQTKDSAEPCKELSFEIKPTRAVVAHGDLSETPQKLAAGGEISKYGDKIEIKFADDDRLEIDNSSGDYLVDSLISNYQKEVHYKGTAWQKTVLTSNHDTRVTFGTHSLSSIEHDGIKEVFPQVLPKGVGCEPRVPASEELSELFADNGLKELNKTLRRIDRREADAQRLFSERHGDKLSVQALSQVIKDRGLLLEKAAEKLPDQERKLTATAENQLRLALKNMREQYGVGTPETRPFAEALGGFLKASHDKDHDDEVGRLEFEAKRAGLMKGVIESIEKSPNLDSQSMPAERAQSLRMSLISVHIAGGDPALKSFVDDVNKRLKQQELLAPKEQGGPFRHGAIIWTPEGSTRYGGSFEIIEK